MAYQLPYLVAPYSALAEVYNRAGFADYARMSTPRYISYAQSINWAGLRVIDIGCGTGASTWYLAERGYRAFGIDNNSHMLAQAQIYTGEADVADLAFDPPTFLEMDIRHLESPIGPVDMVMAVGGVLNAIQSLRELESVFVQVNKALAAGKLFIFDLRTIRGLASEVGDRDDVYYDNGENLMVTVRNQFSYETLSSTRHFLLFRQIDNVWQRQDEIHIERGYPTQGLVAMLERNNFRMAAVLTPDIQPFDVQKDTTGRAVFVVQKKED
jgi:SAM-dependent methyltransferase